MTIEGMGSSLEKKLALATALCERYCSATSVVEKAALFRAEKKILEAHPILHQYLKSGTDEEVVVFSTLAALGQLDRVLCDIDSVESQERSLEDMSELLVNCEQFYAPIGGLLGYYRETIRRILARERQHELSPLEQKVRVEEPPSYDFRKETQETIQAIDDGCRALPKTAEIYTVGGAGERLGLLDEKTEEQLPVAYLRFLGRSLLEHLFRDLEAREYLYEKRYGTPLTVPVVLLTSHEADNDAKIAVLLERHNFFNRSTESIYTVVQFLVPVLDCEGNFTLQHPGQLAAKPGGHGVLWRLLYLQGALEWLQKQKIEHLVVRQINNPLAGLDGALFQLVGVGAGQNKRFGFASMPHQAGQQQGLNVLCVKGEKEGSITNIEYTSFEAILKKDPEFFTRASFAANANILYANLPALMRIIPGVVAPGLLINVKNRYAVYEKGSYVEKEGARLESTMQNIADELLDPIPSGEVCGKEHLSTFLNLHDRAKLFSVTKRPLTSMERPLETPEYCLYDWYKMTRLYFSEVTGAVIPGEQSFHEFMHDGPNMLFSFHPAFGPLWADMRKKMSHIELKKGAFLALEMAEATLHRLSLQGSLSIRSERPCGQKGKPTSIPRVTLSNVVVHNRGLSRPASVAALLQGKAPHDELCEFIVEEGGELVVQDVVLKGPFQVTVPAYTKVTLSMDPTTQEVNCVTTR